MKKAVLVLFVLLSIIPISYAANCGGAVQCNCGDTLVESQTMWYDLMDCPDPFGQNGINIGTDNITLNCAGHFIDGLETFAGDYDGIFLSGRHHVTIENCHVAGFNRGIYIEAGSHDNLIQNNNASYNNDSGITTYQNSDYNAIKNNYASHNGANGIFITRESDNNIITGNILQNNNGGLRFRDYSTYNTVYSNLIKGNEYGIIVPAPSDYNLLYNNTLFNNVQNSWEETNNNDWNSSTIGNYWDDFNINPGYPTYYEISGPGDGIDWHPNAQDRDEDGIFDSIDNCPAVYNPDQLDTDNDGLGNVCDNCPSASNPSQSNSDLDPYGDACDNCVFTTNLGQWDLDRDGIGDWCDNCPATRNFDQLDVDGNGRGDACEGCNYFCKPFCAIAD